MEYMMRYVIESAGGIKAYFPDRKSLEYFWCDLLKYSNNINYKEMTYKSGHEEDRYIIHHTKEYWKIKKRLKEE